MFSDYLKCPKMPVRHVCSHQSRHFTHPQEKFVYISARFHPDMPFGDKTILCMYIQILAALAEGCCLSHGCSD